MTAETIQAFVRTNHIDTVQHSDNKVTDAPQPLTEAQEKEKFNADSGNRAWQTILKNIEEGTYNYVSSDEAKLRVVDILSRIIKENKTAMQELVGVGFVKKLREKERYKAYEREVSHLQTISDSIFPIETADYREDSI